MSIAITGGAGFIGTELARDLSVQNRNFRLLDLYPSEEFPDHFEKCDVTYIADLEKSLDKAQGIIHLAAEHRDDVFPRQKYYDVNVGGAENLVKICEQKDIKTIIFTSTVAVYGLNSGISNENSETRPFNDYGQSKLDAENVLRQWADKNPDRTLGIVRLVATFGPGNRGNIHTLMNQVYKNRFVMVGRGQNRKSIAYVRNVSGFLLHLYENLKPGVSIHNYADKPDLTTETLVKTIRGAFGKAGTGLHIPYFAGIAGGLFFDGLAKVTGKTFPISVVRVRKFCADTIVSAEKVKETGFKPAYNLEDGIRDMIRSDFGNDNDPAQ